METKTVYAFLRFKAEVPIDMSTDDIAEAVERQWEDYTDDFRVNLEDYHQEDFQDPLFAKDDFSVCEKYNLKTEREISVGH
jgi:hypothetical protein